MSNPPPLSQMRAQYDSLIDAGWGIPTKITRLSGTADASGHLQGSFVTKVSGERIWIQALAGHSNVDVKNLDAETTHLAYQKTAGYVLLPKDRLLQSGTTYAYDVIATELMETHRMSQVKLDLRK